MNLDELIRTWDFGKPQDLKIKLNIKSKHRLFNQIESVFETCSDENKNFYFSADYASLEFNYNLDNLPLCQICEKHQDYFLKFHNIDSKLIFEEIMHSYYSFLR